MTECKWRVYYASSQEIKAPRETSNGWMDVSSCIFPLSARCVGGEGGSGNQTGFVQLHPAPAGCLHSATHYSSQLGFYCVSLPEDAFKTLQTFDLSTGRHTCAQSNLFCWLLLLDVTSLDSNWTFNCIFLIYFVGQYNKFAVLIFQLLLFKFQTLMARGGKTEKKGKRV